MRAGRWVLGCREVHVENNTRALELTVEDEIFLSISFLSFFFFLVNFNFGHKEHFMYSVAAGKVQLEERPSKWQDKKVMVQSASFMK